MSIEEPWSMGRENKARIDGIEKTADERHNETMGLLLEINDRLFKDNGDACLQTKIDRNTRWIQSIIWGIPIVLTIIGLTLGVIKLIT